jgi:hypothetical protein
MTTQPPVQQRTEGARREPEHTHPAVSHTHDDYHLVHHHTLNPLGEWEHRTYWHTHEHQHSEIVHSHDYSQDERQHHGKEAHTHRHA